MLHIANNGHGSANPKAMGTAPGDGSQLLARV
jgi:hypothetical protein